jgi:hypothetical protein
MTRYVRHGGVWVRGHRMVRDGGAWVPTIDPSPGPSIVYAYDDTYMDSSNATTNYSAGAFLFLAGYQNLWSNGSFTRFAVARFDLTFARTLPIPPTSINLRVTRHSGSPSAGNGLQARSMLRNYTASQLTWNIYSTGNNWGTAGARSDGVDRGTTLSGLTAAPASAGVSALIDVTTLVTPMIGTTASLLFTYLTSNSGFGVYRSNADNPAFRPALIFSWA